MALLALFDTPGVVAIALNLEMPDWCIFSMVSTWAKQAVADSLPELAKVIRKRRPGQPEEFCAAGDVTSLWAALGDFVMLRDDAHWILRAALMAQVDQAPMLVAWLLTRLGGAGAASALGYKEGLSVMHLCVRYASASVARRVLKLPGIRVDQRDDVGFTPLFMAVRRDNPAMVEVLLEGRSDPNHPAWIDAKADGRQIPVVALDVAVRLRNESITRLLLREPGVRLTPKTLSLAPRDGPIYNLLTTHLRVQGNPLPAAHVHAQGMPFPESTRA
eukprot:TRINITY_DN47889_c0_g1_i1.p1 TRINITY_DN47889_c0_g1~~TRINITY_DN47889_c0_g1_i1.p1  ORF type:complete len:274 (-),score=35.17 TRINITY_DN47889_c0_g1_i1:110-931(-)